MAISVAIVDDNHSLANTLAEKIGLYEELTISFIAYNGQQACEMLASLPAGLLPKVILMDIEMPQMDGIEASAYIKTHYPEIKILVLTVFDHDEKIFKATMAGASGYFLKDEKISRIVEGIDELLSGGAPMSRLVAAKTLDLLRNAQSPKDAHLLSPQDFDLTPREIEILEQISKGLANKEIAETCFISPSTVKKHIENIYAKLHISSRTEAVKIAFGNKWV